MLKKHSNCEEVENLIEITRSRIVGRCYATMLQILSSNLKIIEDRNSKEFLNILRFVFLDDICLLAFDFVSFFFSILELRKIVIRYLALAYRPLDLLVCKFYDCRLLDVSVLLHQPR